MTLAELIQAAREDVLHDIKRPYGWTDEAIARFLSQGEREACRRSGLILDRTTLDDLSDSPRPLCRIQVEAAEAAYAVSTKITRVVSAKLDSVTTPLIQRTEDQLDEIYPLWRTDEGSPVYIVVNLGLIQLVPKPIAEDVARLIVNRLPLRDMKVGEEDAAPEIPEEYHLDLLDWVAFRAFSKLDVDSEQRQLAAEAQGRFDLRFGPPLSARAEAVRRSIPGKLQMRAKPYGNAYPGGLGA